MQEHGSTVTLNLFEFFKISLSDKNLSVKVLTAGIWPTESPAPKCSIPSAASDAFEVFRRCSSVSDIVVLCVPVCEVLCFVFFLQLLPQETHW